MSLLTNWGYTIKADTLPDLLTVTEFNDFTAGKYTGDARIEPNLSAVSSAIRNWCGWHIYPSLDCKFETTMFNPRVTTVGRNALFQLPTKYLSKVRSITIDGADYPVFAQETNGLIKVYGIDFGLYEFSPIEIEYTAGLPDGLMSAIKELAAHRVTHALASSGGIQSETAGGVSITYSANWTNSARSTALADDNKEVLMPYRVQGVF